MKTMFPAALALGAALLSACPAQAADEFLPGHQRLFTHIGKERGWAPTTRLQFDAQRSPRGAYMIGSPETVAKKVLQINEDLGGIDRITFQMTNVALPHLKMQRAIELLGGKVAPVVRKALSAAEAPPAA